MTNLEKYNQAFIEVFGVNAEALNDNFAKDAVEGWDRWRDGIPSTS